MTLFLGAPRMHVTRYPTNPVEATETSLHVFLSYCEVFRIPMKAAVFKEPFSVKTIDKNIPSICLPTDALVKVKYSGLCGSDLHYYRGHIPLKKDNTMGHEFVGSIVAKGSEVLENDLKVGDVVIATFTIQCGNCWYCEHDLSGTCEQTNTFGKTGLEGGQAEYVLVPFASLTLVRKPESSQDVDDSVYVLMADIFVTGYFGVKKILKHFAGSMEAKSMNILQIGAGPVGLCAVRILKHFGFKNVVVVDGIEDRLKHARELGADEIINFKSDDGKLQSLKKSLTEGRGFDAVLEIVGALSAMKTAFENVRRGGFISSVGMGHDLLPFNGLEAYIKCLTVSFGRCNAWSLFHEALVVFEELKEDLASLIDVKCSIDEANVYYERFEKGEVKKVVFTFP